MRKSSLVVLFIGIHVVLKAQVYVQPYLGYSFCTHPITIQSIIIIENSETIYTSKFKYSEGINTGVSIGYNFKNRLSVELNSCINVLSKFNNSVDNKFVYTLSNTTSYYFSGYFGKNNYRAKTYQFAPQLGYTLTKNKLSVGIKAGPNFLKSNVTHTREFMTFKSSELRRVDAYSENEFKSRLNVGIRTSLTLAYAINSNLLATLSFASIYTKCKFTRASTKKYELEGIATTPDYEVSPNSVSLGKTGDTVDFSHVAINVGLKYFLKKIE